MFHLKIVLIGPCKACMRGLVSGKTAIANFLSDSTENAIVDYKPTQGVRIVEFETDNLIMGNRGLKAEIELWDCSGDTKFESLWPAMYKDAHGVIFVNDPSIADSSNKLDYYFESFVNQNGNPGILNTKNCLVIHQIKNSPPPQVTLSNNFSNILQVTANMEENAQKLQSDFNKYITSLLSGVRDRNNQDELNILTLS